MLADHHNPLAGQVEPRWGPLSAFCTIPPQEMQCPNSRSGPREEPLTAEATRSESYYSADPGASLEAARATDGPKQTPGAELPTAAA